MLRRDDNTDWRQQQKSTFLIILSFTFRLDYVTAYLVNVLLYDNARAIRWRVHDMTLLPSSFPSTAVNQES